MSKFSEPVMPHVMGLAYKSVDGREWPTIKQAEAVNRDYYESQLIKNQNYIDETPLYHR